MARFSSLLIAAALLVAVCAADADTTAAAIEKARGLQNEADALREELTQKMLQIEEEFHKKQQPAFQSRNDALSDVPGFWIRVIENHPSHSGWFRGTDREIMNHLKDIRVEDTHPDGAMATQSHNFKITFTFNPNPFFSDASLSRQVQPSDEPAAVSQINWIAGQKPADASFFNFFEKAPGDESGVPFLDPHTLSDIAHVIRYELWPSPFQFYDIPSIEEQLAQMGTTGEGETFSEEVQPVHEEAIGEGASTENPPPDEMPEEVPEEHQQQGEGNL